MNMMGSFGRTRCPYCRHPMMPWEPGHRIHHCERCRRALVIYRFISQPRTWRIAPVVIAVHAITAIMLIVGVAAVALLGLSLGWLAFAIAVPVAVFSASDVADGWLSWRTGIGLFLLKLRQGRVARILGILRVAFGLAGCAVVLIGLLALGELQRPSLSVPPPAAARSTAR